MKRLLAFSLTALLALSASADRFLSPPQLWAIDFYIAPGVCVKQLRFDWGNLHILNRKNLNDPRVTMTICGGQEGNGIGRYAYDSPMPSQPLNISWQTPEGVLHSYALDVQSAFPQRSLTGARLSVRLMGDGVALAIRDSGIGFLATRMYTPTPSDKK